MTGSRGWGGLAALAARLRRGVAATPDLGAGDARWVVLDLETSGLDQRSDTLLAIGALALVRGRVVVGDSFEMVVRPDRTSSRPNILIHGIGEQAQMAGVDPVQACERFVDFVGNSPLIAFHAGFDRAFVGRALHRYLGRELDNPWIDLAELAPAVFVERGPGSLDAWLSHLGIEIDRRHEAVADALAAAMLMQRIWARLPPQDRCLAGMRRLCRQGRWLGR